MPLNTSTFEYSRIYSISTESEYDPIPDPIFDITYSAPENIVDIKANNILSIDNIYIQGYLWDQFESKGLVGNVLLSDVNGVFWGYAASANPPIQAIDVFDQGAFRGTISRLDFYDGSDPNNLVKAQISAGSTSVANITISDRWSLSGSDIYRNSNVGINVNTPRSTLDVLGNTNLDGTLTVSGIVNISNNTSSTGKDTGALVVDGGVGIEQNLNVGSNVFISGNTSSIDKDTGALVVDGGVGIEQNLNVGNNVSISGNTSSIDKDTGALVVDGGVGIEQNLNVGGDTKLIGSLELDSSLIDVNGSTATGKVDYRLASVGTGVSWRPSGVETQNTIWVTKDGNDSNSGLLEGDAKATVGAAASIAQPGDTIVIRPGVYSENNPIGLRTDVTVTGQDIRLVTIRPINTNKDVFHVRRGCLIENINFAGSSVLVDHSRCAAVAFPPTDSLEQANTGFIALGPANEGTSGRWRSPYVRNCTNFMSGSIGMKINGDHATASTLGNDLKCMVCDSFTQYNENGIGVSITNNGYAQLVSIFTINCNIGIYCDSGGSCDLTNSNSSFGNFGLYAVGIGSTEFTGTVGTYPPTRTQPGVDASSDIVAFENIGNNRRPYDGQCLFFKLNLDNYPDAIGTGIIQDPMVEIQEIVVINGGSGFSAATPPTIIIRDADDGTQQPKGPQGIIADLSPTIDPVSGAITAIDIINSGRNYLSTQNLEVFIDGGNLVGASASVITRPIYYSVDSATENSAGITTVTFTEFIPYELLGGEEVSFRRISRILTSSHSFEYIGTGTSINTSTPFNGGVPIKANEIVALDGAQIPFTSTDQKGNFDIGEGFQINQPTATIRGRDFSKALQAEITPIIFALR
jgi:hypothetical protein